MRPRQLKVIYVVGSPHSGSTLLDLLLNAHPDVVAVGELKQIARPPVARHNTEACTCGAFTAQDCPFWSRVDAAVRSEGHRTLDSLNVEDPSRTEDFSVDNLRLFRAVREVSGKDYIVDSSKSWRRLDLLRTMKEIDLFPVFLQRNPVGQVLSLTRARQRSKGMAHKPLSNADIVNAAAEYSRKNRTIYRKVRNDRHFAVQYEALVRNPAAVVGSLMRYVGLEFHPDQLNWREHESHNIGGNMMRFTATTSHLVLDERWRTELSLPQRFMINGRTFLARYPFLGLQLWPSSRSSSLAPRRNAGRKAPS